ncbi:MULTISPECIES: MFS transporter [Haloferax]|uniref:MFS transporter n=2 Tax=Haloferax TaxID=2251 RepID=A0A6G1Z149_9EURY|nr:MULTISPECIES: MFS transporter [Haloferax]KAB1187559.1 MFS transporter [Haloferax sp. CBA1149]MRW80215.1 MFS transporter [Haloferax marinisediminis]
MAEPELRERQGTVTVTGWQTWGTLGGLFLVSAGFIAYAIAPASVLPLFMDTFSIGKTAASASISAVFLTWALLQIPGGYLLDRFDNRYLVFLGTGLFILASLTGLFVDSYTLFLGTRLVSGACAVFVIVGSVNILGRLLPENFEALGLSIFIASPPFGVAVAQYSGPRLAALYGWKSAILVYTLVALFGLAVSVTVLRQPVKADSRVTVHQFVAALRNPTILIISTASFCTYAVWTFLNTWMPTYGTEVLGIELAAAGATTALVPLAGIVSRPGGGWLSEKLGGRLQPVILISFLASILFLYLLSIAPSPTTFAILLGLTGGAVNLAVGLYLVYVNSVADASTHGTSLAVLLTFSQVGNLVAPLVGGWLIAQLSWTAGFGFAAGLAIVGVVLVVFVPTTR